MFTNQLSHVSTKNIGTSLYIASCGAQVCQEKLRLSEEKAAEVVGHF